MVRQISLLSPSPSSFCLPLFPPLVSTQQDTTCNWCYPANGNANDPENITLSYGGDPLSDQPWAGPLINGKGRGIPLNYSSEPGSATSIQWGAPKGAYFSVNVDQGETYRLRIVNTAIEWGFRFWIEGHDMTIISISGGDVKPIFIPTKEPGKPFYQNGIELSPAERYDVLITANYNDQGKKRSRKAAPTAPDQTAFVIHVDSTDGCYKGTYDGTLVVAGIRPPPCDAMMMISTRLRAPGLPLPAHPSTLSMRTWAPGLPAPDHHHHHIHPLTHIDFPFLFLSLFTRTQAWASSCTTTRS